MPVIKREDGINFAVYTYREVINFKRSNLLKREVAMLAEENGEFARFFPQITGDIEVIFSRDQGYLLGESVWDHFDRANDLVFCEQLSGGETAALVVIRGGSVYLDAEVPLENLVDEFAALTTGSNHYDIYVHGEVPLSELPREDCFCFDAAFVKSFTELEEPVFPQLGADPDYALLPYNEAFAKLPVKRGKGIAGILAIIAVIVVGYVAWDIFKPAPPPPPSAVIATPQNPYAAYQAALNNPSPEDILMALARGVRESFTLPGWEALSFNLNGSNADVSLQSVGGTTELLLLWVKQHNAALSVSSGRASISLQLPVKNREKIMVIYKTDDIVSMVYDRLNHTFIGATVSIKKPVTKENYQSTAMQVSLSGVAPQTLEFLGRELDNLPIVLDSASFSLTGGLLSGNVQLSILGSKD